MTPQKQGAVTTQRATWIDIVRILLMLAIIDVHMGNCNPIWHIYGFVFNLEAAVAFYIFLAALFVKENNHLVFQRIFWLTACYLFWGCAHYFLLSPLSSAIESWIQTKQFDISIPHFTLAPWDEIILYDYTKTFPHNGPLWFLRFLIIFTLLTPLLRMLSPKILYAGALLFFSLRYTPLVIDETYKSYLPFFITSKPVTLCVATYFVGLGIARKGGIAVLRAIADKCTIPALLTILYISAIVFLLFRSPTLVNNSIFPYINEIASIFAPFAACFIFLQLSKSPRIHYLFQWVKPVAPCIFTVYVLHCSIIPIFNAFGNTCVPENYMFIHTLLSPVLIFIIAWLMWRAMLCIPHCSMLLCFTKAAPKK